MKDAVVRPYALVQFFVHPHPFRQALAAFERLSRLMKLAILGKHSAGSPFWLVNSFWLGDTCTAWLIMALVYEGGSTILNSISIRCVPTLGH